jgi:hypothetical protein
MKTYKIIDKSNLQVQYTFIADSKFGIKQYHLLDSNEETLLYATDTEDKLVFSDKLHRKMKYYKLEYLYIFLKLISLSDKQLFDSYIVCEELENI